MIPANTIPTATGAETSESFYSIQSVRLRAVEKDEEGGVLTVVERLAIHRVDSRQAEHDRDEDYECVGAQERVSMQTEGLR
jgi:hypothetical protein